MKEFWESQAEKYGEDVTAVNFDINVEVIGNKVIGDLVEDGLAVADVGCGNGRTLINLATQLKNGTFKGFDFARGMVDAAEARRERLGLKNISFYQWDAADGLLPQDTKGTFDLVLGKRLLINMRGPGRVQAVANVADMLKAGGKYIMIECFAEPLERINDVRESLSLDRIKVKEFNEYLTEDFMVEVQKSFSVEKKIDDGSLYYFVSRIFNAALTEGSPDYRAPINQLATKLTLNGVVPMQGYAPEIAYVLTKR